MDYDNTITLPDENGDEIEFEIAEEMSYQGTKYFLLLGEDEFCEDVFVVVTKVNGEYEIVEDEDIVERISTKFSESMSDFGSILTESILDNDINIEDQNSDDVIDEPYVTDFDVDAYIVQSQDFLFKQGLKEYANSNYEEAYSNFENAISEGNIFAYAHIGIMHRHGEGCLKSDELAIKAFREGAKLGCPLAASWVAECYRMGYAVEKDKEFSKRLQLKSLNALKSMYDVEDISALYFLGFNLIFGINSEKNMSEGVRLLEIATYKGDRTSAILLAECYLKGLGVNSDAQKAVELLIQNPLEENKKFHYLLGKCYLQGNGIEQDLHKALEHLKKSAKLGHCMAKSDLGDFYYEGCGVPVDYYEAMKWYKDALDNHSDSYSACRLGFMYMFGEGTSKNEQTAMNYYRIAAEKGDTLAQRIISREYLCGGRLPKDYTKAKEWIEKAAKKGDTKAQIILGSYYANDYGFKDFKMTYKWFLEAANQGDDEAKYLVGKCHLYEIGTKFDLESANEWFMKAVKDGNKEAAYELGISYLDGRGMDIDSDSGVQLLEIAANAGIRESSRELAKRFHYGIKNFHGDAIYKNPSKAQEYAILAVKDDKDDEAQFLMGVILEEDFGNTQTAIDWYIRAADNGNPKAKLNLSKKYINNNENGTKALEMLRDLISQNNGEAQYLYAKCFEEGIGCSKDKKKAKKYYQLAKENGYIAPTKPKKRFKFF